MSEKIKILYVLEAAAGGTRRYISQLLMNIDLDCFEPLLFCSVKREPDFIHDIEKIKDRGISVRVFPMKRGIAPLSDLLAVIRMTKAIKSEKPDIVHTHSSKAGIIGRISAKFANTAVIVHTPHVFPFEMKTASWIARRVYLMLERSVAKSTSLLIAVSEYEKNTALKYALFSEKNIRVNRNGVDIDLWQPDFGKRAAVREELGFLDDDFVVGMVGRFMAQKGHDALIESAEILLQKDKRFKFVLVGDGRLKNRIREMVNLKKMDENFLFLDQTERIADYYLSFDALALPSRWEGCPYTLLEAMAMEIPVVACNVGGVGEIIENGVSGILVPPGDTAKFAENLRQICEDRRFRNTLSANARKRIKKDFLLRDMLDNLKKIYQRIYNNEIS